MSNATPLQEETILYVGRIATQVGKVFFTYIDRDPDLVEYRTHAIWTASRRSDEGATYCIDSISLPGGQTLALGYPRCEGLAG